MSDDRLRYDAHVGDTVGVRSDRNPPIARVGDVQHVIHAADAIAMGDSLLDFYRLDARIQNMA
jgi:hypothetical protein